jgi:hypothetical protein
VSRVESDLSKMIYNDCATIVRERGLLSTNDIFQLTFVLTLDGRASSRKDIFVREVNRTSDPSDHSAKYVERRVDTDSDDAEDHFTILNWGKKE